MAGDVVDEIRSLGRGFGALERIKPFLSVRVRIVAVLGRSTEIQSYLPFKPSWKIVLFRRMTEATIALYMNVFLTSS